MSDGLHPHPRGHHPGSCTKACRGGHRGHHHPDEVRFAMHGRDGSVAGGRVYSAEEVRQAAARDSWQLKRSTRPAPRTVPYPPAWETEHIRSPAGYTRIRTVRSGDALIRIGVRPDGKSETISVLRPKAPNGGA